MNLKQKKKQVVAVALAIVLAAGSGLAAVPAAAPVYAAEAQTSNSDLGVATRSISDIRQAFQETYDYNALRNSTITYTETPRLDRVEQLRAGAVDSTDGLQAVNLIRYIAGLDSVTNNTAFATETQHTAAFLAFRGQGLIGVPTSFPGKPTNMKQAFYNTAEDGFEESLLYTSSGNIGLPDTVFSYVKDTNKLSTLENRRWLLNDNLKTVGFGFAEKDGGSVASLYVDKTDASKQSSQKTVVWPAQKMPMELFGSEQSWSITLGDLEKNKIINDVNAGKGYFKVTLTKIADQNGEVNNGQSLTFTLDGTGNGGQMWLDEEGVYGSKNPTIIFKPSNLTYKAGDVYEVKVTGLVEPMTYTVTFFDALGEGTGYTATFAAGGAQGTVASMVADEETGELTLPSSSGLTRQDYTFQGWRSSADNEVYNAGEKVTLTQNTTFTAQWEMNSSLADKELVLDTQSLYMIAGISQHDFLVEGINDLTGLEVTSGDESVATVELVDGEDERGAKYRITAQEEGDTQITVNFGNQTATIDVVVYPVAGSITLDTVSYTMAPGDIYDIGITVRDPDNNPLSGEAVQAMFESGKLRVVDSRTGSVVRMQQLPNGNFRLTAVDTGTCYIECGVMKDAWTPATRASIRVDVQRRAVQGGVSARNTSYWAEEPTTR